MDNSSYFSLGATLYTPCNHPNLQTIMSNGLGSKSMVFCTEDAIPEHELEQSIDKLRSSIKKLSQDKATFKRFIRPRTPSLLEEIMQFDGIENIDGFVLPKYDLSTCDDYHRVLEQSTINFEIMPTLESLDVMEPLKLPKIRESLNKIKGDVICLRIGGNDLFNILGIKRMPNHTIYDTPLRIIIENLIINFRPYGYELSAPVFDMMDDQETLNKELSLDVNYGFFGKTAIHPKQVSIIEDFFKSYSISHIEQADSVFKEYAPAVYRMNGQMMEVTCHSNWAKRTISLANSF
ncbi:HpcH/HpaI aldolase/citrate lyase family protein [Vibrio campbellii]|uniref:HpcH/HpaI aldolase/citrate lyase family protein n=1 Tax=Vibrio campbellii TaxID=680 RepID=A0ABY5IE20_9VIBR|nr:HpcH/HpaI aldolase/citrate lyase family protein [Vibrio campbellii]UTZ21481.1 HpcH/HpaI aldolase/citrate lyase family protein [Vibrio campbellii]UTZ31139.1 HpcH/HpaI aldolase/citrate lyase family protein [Vibrio campbellii]